MNNFKVTLDIEHTVDLTIVAVENQPIQVFLFQIGLTDEYTTFENDTEDVGEIVNRAIRFYEEKCLDE